MCRQVRNRVTPKEFASISGAAYGISFVTGTSATGIAVQSDRSLRSTLAIAAMVFQLRVVTETP